MLLERVRMRSSSPGYLCRPFLPHGLRQDLRLPCIGRWRPCIMEAWNLLRGDRIVLPGVPATDSDARKTFRVAMIDIFRSLN